MRQFYLGKNKHGYYRAYFVDISTGLITSAKSTHTKDKLEAAVIATSMLNNGVPAARSNSQAFAFAASKNFIVSELVSKTSTPIPLPVSELVPAPTPIPEPVPEIKNAPAPSEPVKNDGIKICEFL